MRAQRNLPRLPSYPIRVSVHSLPTQEKELYLDHRQDFLDDAEGDCGGRDT